MASVPLVLRWCLVFVSGWVAGQILLCSYSPYYDDAAALGTTTTTFSQTNPPTRLRQTSSSSSSSSPASTSSSAPPFHIIDIDRARRQQQQQSSSRDHIVIEPQIGILTVNDPAYFQAFQQEIDDMDEHERCKRYGFGYDEAKKRRRRIFYGAIIASEPWELYELVAAEAFGIYAGIVFVESNRTQNFSARNLTRYQATVHYNQRYQPIEDAIHQLFGLPSPTITNTTTAKNKQSQVQVRFWSNEDASLVDLEREKAQRDAILLGWQELGMTTNDVAILGDLDEVFTRDVLRAIQACATIPELDYRYHQCRPDRMGLRATTQIYEGTPECVTADRTGFHPSIFSGQCVEGIGNNEDENENENTTNINNTTNMNDEKKMMKVTSMHRPAPRDPRTGDRRPGWGRTDWNQTNEYTPLVNGGDFRSTGGARTLNIIESLDEYRRQQQQQEEEIEQDEKESGRRRRRLLEKAPSTSVNSIDETNTDQEKLGNRSKDKDNEGGVEDDQNEEEEEKNEEGNDSDDTSSEDISKGRVYEAFTAYHFHNFFTSGETIRFKYKTYGHADPDAHKTQIVDLHEDLALMTYCVQNVDDPKASTYKRLVGGYEQLNSFTPIYFKDADYRRRRHEHVRTMIAVQEVEWSDQQRDQQQRVRRIELERQQQDPASRLQLLHKRIESFKNADDNK